MKQHQSVGSSLLLGLAIVGATLFCGCGGNDNNTSPTFAANTSTAVTTPGPVTTTTATVTATVTATPAPTQFKQVEQLGRPGINEALVTNNDFLNGYNSLLPAQEGAALAGNPTLAADPLATLTATATFGGDPNPAARVGDEVTAFVPDMLRIDTGVASPNNGVGGSGVYVTAYTSGAVPVGASQAGRTVPVVRPCGGRKFEDDVIDLTLSVLTNGATGPLAPAVINGVTVAPSAQPGDGVEFPGDANPADAGTSAVDPQGNPSQGHHLLRGQTAPFGPCNDANPTATGGDSFPYMAGPN